MNLSDTAEAKKLSKLKFTHRTDNIFRGILFKERNKAGRKPTDQPTNQPTNQATILDLNPNTGTNTDTAVVLQI